jgi:hypothetical protein
MYYYIIYMYYYIIYMYYYIIYIYIFNINLGVSQQSIPPGKNTKLLNINIYFYRL